MDLPLKQPEASKEVASTGMATPFVEVLETYSGSFHGRSVRRSSIQLPWKLLPLPRKLPQLLWKLPPVSVEVAEASVEVVEASVDVVEASIETSTSFHYENQ